MKGLLASLKIILGLDSSQFKRGMNEAEQKTNKFGNFMKRIGSTIAGVFAVQQIFAFGKELLTLGGIAEGVRSAFNRIADDQTLRDLQEATKGTVSELELMKNAVKAQNLGIPIESLANLFAFASKRAQETGQSVEYLVESISLGIGRKSIPILDNLGITSTQLREKFDELGLSGQSVGDYAAAAAAIASDSLEETGGLIDTNATKLERLGSAWQDMKQEFAEDEELSNTFGSVLDFMTAFVKHIPQMIKDWKRWGENFNAVMSGGISLLWKRKKVTDETTESQVKQNEETSEFNNLLEEVTVKAEENNKAWEKKFQIWDENNKKASKQLDLLRDINDVNYELNKVLQKNAEEAKKFFETSNIASQSEISGDFSDMFDSVVFGGEKEQDTSNFEKIAAYNRKWQETELQNWNAFKDQMASLAVGFGIDVVSELGAAFGELAVTGEFPKDFGKNILSIIGSFISQLGQMLIGLGVASEAFQELLKSAFTNPVSAGLAIAAGAALVLLGGAISGAAKAGPKASTSGSVAPPSYSSTYGSSGTTQRGESKVVFELEGTKLRGVLNNLDRKYGLIR